MHMGHMPLKATTNLLLVMTFILVLAFRYEKLGIHTFFDQAKVVETLLGIGGAMLLTFYKGVDITPWHSHLNLVATLTQRRVNHPHLLLCAHPSAEHSPAHHAPSVSHALASPSL
jgi:hypothetical protein